MSDNRSTWTSRIGFILASAGAAIGLGAIWKFPYLAGSNGGSVFMFPYIILSFTIGLVLLIAEVGLGRTGKGCIVTAYRAIAGKNWTIWGYLGVLTGFMVLCFYSTIGGWTLSYLIDSAVGKGLVSNQEELGAIFGGLVSDPIKSMGFQALFLFLTGWVVAYEISRGIEKISKVLMPLLLVLVIVVIVRGVTLPGASEGLAYLFSWNPEAFSWKSLLAAMGFTFFSLSLGAGIMVTYGSYLSSHTDIPGSSVWVAFLSTQAALLAGVMIIPAVFAFGMDPAAGTGLVFITIPMIFEHMPLADILAAAFYVCLFIAAITSSVSLLEVVVAYLINEWKMRRRAATALCWVTLFILASIQALSFSSLSWVEIHGMSLFDFSDYVCSNILMPIGGLCIAALAGWKAWPVMKEQMLAIRQHSWLTLGWIRLTISLLAPALVIVVLVSGI